MERPVKVEVVIEAEFDVGSPPDGDSDPYQVANPVVWEASSTWMSREGVNEGILTSATTALYPPFEDATRRTIVGIVQFASGSAVVTWNAGSVTVERIWINTDPSWSTSVTTSAMREGAWFAIEGELETDYRKWKEGQDVDATL